MINASVLVLNRSFQPLHVTSARRAFTLLYAGIARALDRQFEMYDFASWAALAAEEGDDVVHTVDRVIRIPRVITLQFYDRLPRTRVRFSRHNIYARDQNTCQYCGRRLPRADLNLDHVVPKRLGGRTTWENVVCCCLTCNLRKGGRTPDQARMRLTRAPYRPKWNPLTRTQEGSVRYQEWLPFLRFIDAAYWNVELEE
jgi:5-methylcytosine-specific restriction endonuclease McrA